MRILKRLLMGFGSILAAALLLAVTVPKSAHAIAAALVQVTNTTANPVPVLDVRASAAQNVELACTFTAGYCVQINPDGSAVDAAWTVPTGMQYVITDVEISSAMSTGVTSTIFGLQWTPPGGSLRLERWSVTANSTTTEYQFPSGVVVLPGSTITCISGGSLNYGYVRGYLAPS
jgi:hypothetical protein